MASNSSIRPISFQELRDLILPILACLPTAFLAPQPPPALYPLLSPILRQRVHLLSTTTSRSTEPPSQGAWLKLLTWSSERAVRLVDIVSRLQLEPHPISGELELFSDTSDADAGRVWYRRLDEETIQARAYVKDYELGFIYVWCTNDSGGIGLENGGTGASSDGWKVAEVVPLGGDEDLELEGWHDDIHNMDQNNSRSIHHGQNGTANPRVRSANEGSDDDAYWASYDQTPGKDTPGTTRAAPTANAIGSATQSEQEYFSRYEAVQPAMDAHDPEEEVASRELNSINHHPTNETLAGQPHDRIPLSPQPANYAQFTRLNDAIEQPSVLDVSRGTNHVTQSSGMASASVASQARSEASAAAETSVKHHIGTEIKSLSRLAQGVGMDRDEFVDVVQRELGLLPLGEF